MCLRKVNSGFTLIELLITLTIIGIAISLVAPSVFTWLASHEVASMRNELRGQLSMLPLHANRQNKKLIIETAEKLNSENALPVVFEQPVTVLPNGYCLEGIVRLNLGERIFRYQVTSPLCEVRPLDA